MSESLMQALNALAQERGLEVPAPDKNGSIKMTVRGVELALTCPNGSSDDVYCHAVVGTVAGLAHPDRVFEDALAANFFWKGTAGGTLSILPETDELMLADRRDGDFFDSAATLIDYLSAFAAKVREWRVYLDDCRIETEVK